MNLFLNRIKQQQKRKKTVKKPVNIIYFDVQDAFLE